MWPRITLTNVAIHRYVNYFKNCAVTIAVCTLQLLILTSQCAYLGRK